MLFIRDPSWHVGRQAFSEECHFRETSKGVAQLPSVASGEAHQVATSPKAGTPSQHLWDTHPVCGCAA